MIERVALVSPYDFAQNGGVTEHVRHLTTELRRRNIDVTIIAPTSRPELDEPGLVSLGTIMPIPINGSIAHTTISPVVIDEVSALLARTSFDIVHIHEPLAPMLPLSVLNASRSPNIGTFHASGGRSLGYAVSHPLLNWLAQRLTKRIAVSRAAASFAQRYFDGDYTIIPNGIDTGQFNVGVEPLPQWRDGRPTVLFVGRFSEPRKGFETLLTSFAEVQRAIPEARLLVVGRGDAAPFQQQADDLGLHSIHFVGVASPADLPRYYRSADVFCAPSTGQESFGIILVEAMSSGCPVVASDIAGYAQVVTHRHNGLLVPPNNSDALAATLIQTLRDDRLRQRLAVNGPQTARQYAWGDVSEQIVDVYNQAQVQLRPATIVLPVPAFPKPVPLLATASGAILTAEPVVQSAPYMATGANQGVNDMLTEPFEARVRTVTQRIVGRVLGRSRISPNALTLIGLFLTLTVTLTLATGHLAWGGLLVLVTSAFDMLDGALARATDRKSTFGAFFDSTIDRYSEALVFLGLLLYYQRVPGVHFEATLVYLAIIGSLMVSYTRARAEALGVECKVGILARPERVILLAFGLLVGWLPFTLAILAIFTNLTAVQRIYHVWLQTDGGQQKVIKPQRRGWFASRDQSPS